MEPAKVSLYSFINSSVQRADRLAGSRKANPTRSCQILASSGLGASAGGFREPLLLPRGVDKAGWRGPPGWRRSREAQPADKTPAPT